MGNPVESILWNRLKYVLSPQYDIYRQVANIVRDRVADIGFGTGFGTHLLELKAKEVYAYEIDEQAIGFAQDVFPFKSLHFQYGDIERGINDGLFDFIVMIDVIEHIKDDRQALMNVKKMLTTNGTFICSTPNRLSRYRKSENHYREYGPRDIETLLKRIFVSVALKNYHLDTLISQYENPIIAICKNIE